MFYQDYRILGELALPLMSLASFSTNLEHSLPLDTHTTCMCNLVELPSLQQWQDSHTLHMKPNIHFMGILLNSILP